MVSEGDRVEVLQTTDNDLEKWDTGTVDDIQMISETVTPEGEPARKQIWVDWDDGKYLALLEGVDHYRILEDAD